MNRWIGQAPLRREGVEKVTGRSRYIDDLVMDDMWHGITVRSPVPRGRLKKIHFDPGVPWDEFVVVTAKDIPGKNYVALIETDQPLLVDELVNHAEEPVLLLAHPDKHILDKARRLVRLDIEALPAVLTIDDSLAQKQIIWRDDNVFKHYLVQKGDVDAAMRGKDLLIIEGSYETGAQEQLYIEPNGMIAAYDEHTGVTVWGSMQCPYYVHKALLAGLNLAAEKIRVVQAETGGGFGGKEEYPSILAAHACLLAMKSKHPVKMIYDRAEDMAATTKRHPSRTHHRTAVTKDGKLVAQDIKFELDGGAYATLSAVVLSRGTIHAAGPYLCDNVRIHSTAVATNHPPHGAFRGFGAPQSIFALERHLDKVAAAVGLPPEELRRRNFLKDGDLTATQQVVRDGVDMNGVMELAIDKADYTRKRAAYAESNKTSSTKRGIGIATFFHGSGFTGSGEVRLASVVGMDLLPDGRARVLSASTEIGQGTNTVFSQVAAEALGVSLDCVTVAQPDTALVPDSGPTVASRTVMIVGKLVQNAADAVKKTLQQAGMLGKTYTDAEFLSAGKAYIQKYGALRCNAQYQAPANVNWDDKLYKGDAYAAFAWATYIADVSVDPSTYEATVHDFVAVQEIGRVVHPLLAAGQIEGGVAQAIGYAMYEKVVWKDGRMINNQMTNYIMPTSADLPNIRVFFTEQPTQHGPGGAKGIGELPMDGPAPAIANAIAFALGRAIDVIPALPEAIFEGAAR